ncbi:uncharacterized protein LOC131145763 [Malania oleifera]|uniref:uncharacterized protein LOC131145763 n=1 Tax=Malania oleifera TaxID=397392 RepID=UPI0025AE92E1|nr:uncharacterized protein LOC131145763 [Malania oleifera]
MKKEPKEQNCPFAGQGYSIKEFMRMNTPTFTRGPDPVLAENWVQEIEEIMIVLDCMDEQKVRYATFKMTREAKRWWLSGKLLEDQRVVKIAFTWERFKELSLTAKFVELSHFTPFLVPNEVKKSRKIEKVQRRRIYELVVGFQVKSFLELVDKASMLEKSIQSSIDPSEQKKRPAPFSFQSEASQGSAKKGKEAIRSICLMCNKKHMGEC